MPGVTNEFCQNDSMSNVDVTHEMQDENGDEQVNMRNDEDGEGDSGDDSCEDGDDGGGSYGDGDSDSDGNGDDDGDDEGDADGDDYIDDNDDDIGDGDEIVEDDNDGTCEDIDIDDDHDDASIVLSNNSSDNETDETDIKEDEGRMEKNMSSWSEIQIAGKCFWMSLTRLRDRSLGALLYLTLNR